MSGQVHVLAIITPAKGKEARVGQLLTDLANNVKQNEKDVPKYELFEQYNGQGGNVFVVEEIYNNQAVYDAHFKTDYFTALGETIQKEGLLAAPLDIKTIKPIGGFASR
ncbi:uncharacterized protein K444DRAFT_658163 [Hyaloscypha bicolor E]|uniref:ABM domain-containing protein n=1 Tax=Hyaloscypha bicolor E TaxID=1095630 RepID=A0A2J6TVE0_9HELO|nr:uncharacterized protein K444DRAFT_658163 [Hyaloscypha bicolor E]PMD66983.1 hypothetical protein K444DRAFT_658163 [Hyaloscypha bicolor E]